MKILYILLIVGVLSPFFGVSQDVISVQFEDNKEYVTLLEVESRLKLQEDSLSKKIAIIRANFKRDEDNRDKYSAQILQIEETLFDIRSKLGITSEEINSIEQEFIIANLSGENRSNPSELALSNGSIVSSASRMIENSVFIDNLSSRDYTTLKQAHSKEISVMKYIAIYTTNYNSIANIRDAYMTEADIVVADSLYEKYNSLRSLNRVIGDTISNIWSGLYDNKSYYYTLILDKLNKTESISNFGVKLALTEQRERELTSKYHSDILCTYYLERKMILDNEIEISKLFDLDVALDSLYIELKALELFNYKLERINIKERLFIDYDTIEFHKPSKYNYSNPIPKYEIPIRGDVYRLLVGSYTVRQSPAIFRGAYPISYVKGSNRRYSYYIGSFKTIDEAVNSVKELKFRGFRNPLIVGWVDGEQVDIDMKAEMGHDDSVYRLQIDLNGDIPEEVVEYVRENTINKDISRVDKLYTIGLFNSKASATRLYEGVKKIAPDLRVVILEVNL